MHEKNLNKICLGLSIISSILFVLIYSWTTSPLYHWINFDSSVYRVMGWMTSQGSIPYKDMFDHKGPFFVLLETIGHLLNPSFGIAIIQMIVWFFTFWGTYKILGEFFKSKKIIVALCFSVSVYIFLYYISAGNYVEEYCLPFLVWSYVYLIRYFINSKDNHQHNPKYAILYGFSFAVCAFTKLSNAIPLCITIAVIVIVLILNKKWKNLLINTVAFIFGMFICALPFLIWFGANGALGDMFYATFVFNFKYVNYYHPTINNTVLIKQVLRYLSIFGIGFIVLWLNKRKILLNIAVSLQLLTGIIFFFGGAKFLHYLIIWIPSVIIALCIGWTSNTHTKICKTVIAITMCYILAMMLFSFSDCHNIYASDRTQRFEKEIDRVINKIPKKDKKSVVALNSSAHIYLYGNIKPCFKYFVLQDFHSKVDNKIQEYLDTNLEKQKARYIIIEKAYNKKLKESFINNYDYVMETKSLKLYRAKGK